MNETLYASNGLDETRLKRAFRWVITFRDFPTGSYQTVDGDSMMTEALTLFTKGRAAFYLDGVKRGDRVPGILSSEYEVLGQGGIFEIRYVEPTTRVCIPAALNNRKLPNVSKIMLRAGESIEMQPNTKILVCLGEVQVAEKIFKEEQTFTVGAEPRSITANCEVILLNFTEA